ncbi:hypothetical protein PENDEC_c002G03327 [Penicillium decumbens]|uniref:Uncharacterized protein n=1 Tax=Penicillium decumbens TaxID=69771 RepID=A0A1V6PL59_PENDC|nr:hypothetical protein PENDEC_c002G03327 [Penicillium decumbens]
MARILITGSTDGFGLEAARQLVERNHTVYLHARNQERANDVKAKCPGAAGMLIADLTSVTETRKLVEEANAIGTFDAIIHNAGLFLGPFRKTPDTGMPAMVFVNLIAPYILSCLLKQPKRLIFISSTLHKQANTDVKDTFWFERGENEWQDSQAKAVEGHFGHVCASWMGCYQAWRSRSSDKLEDGVETYVMLAEGDYDQSLTGVYFDPKKKLGEPIAATADENLQEVVVKACEDITGIKLGA